MTKHPLDNPIWSSLSSLHAAYAQQHGEVVRYPAPVAPFLGVPAGAIDVAAGLDALVAGAENVYLLGPELATPPGWQLRPLGLLAQMVCPKPVVELDGPVISALSAAHREDVLALTALVYPHYFRPQTMDLGRYFGIYQHGRLAAMIGERMGMPGYREVSAVCTHPDFAGRSYARHLLAWLSNDILAGGAQPFLHVSPQNGRAKNLYEHNGYRTRHLIAFWSLCREPG